MSSPARNFPDPIPQETLAEAGVWLAKLHGDSRGKKLEDGFHEWLRASPVNARAFEMTTDVWQEAGNLRRIVPLAAAPRPRFTLRVGMAIGVLIAAVVALGAWFLLPGGTATNVGEQRTLNLEDGTHVRSEEHTSELQSLV